MPGHPAGYPAKARPRIRWSALGWEVLKYSLAALVVVLTAFPIWWLFSTSLKREADFFVTPPAFFFTPTLANYQEAVFNAEFAHFLLNTLIVASSVAVLTVGVGSLAAYALARYKFPGARLISLAILSARLIPGATMIIPYFVLLQRLHLTDTLLGLILSYTGFTLPFAAWMMYGFFLEVPSDVEDSARIDGCSDFEVFQHIVLPLARPGLGATAILIFINAWNEFLYALVLTSRLSRTLSVHLASSIQETTVDWGALFAIGAVMLIPAFILTLLIQGSLVRGLTAGAVKG